MTTKLIKAINKQIGEPLSDLVWIVPPMLFLLPFFLLFSAVDLCGRVSPVVSRRLLACATEDELPLVREVICKAKGRPTGHALRRLRNLLERRADERKEAAALQTISDQCSQ